MTLIDFSNFPFEDYSTYNYYFPSLLELKETANVQNFDECYGNMSSFVIGRIELQTALFEDYERIFKI